MFTLPELAGLHRVAQPERRRIEAQNVADLQNAFVLIGQFGELLRFVVRQRQRFFHKHVLAGFEKFLAQREMMSAPA